MEVRGTITYDKHRQIGMGEGLNSQVYVATDRQFAKTIAVKEIAKVSFGNDPSLFFQEAQALFEVQHENVVSVQYCCETETSIGLAMPYYAAGSLASLIKKCGLPLDMLLRVAQDVLSGVGAVHRAKLVHLDVRPPNVLFDDRGKALITDFGHARRMKDGVASFPSGYQACLPPEVVDQRIATAASDIYQVGLLLYRAANGEPFYQKQKAAVANIVDRIRRGKFPDRSQFSPHVPPRLCSIIRKSLNPKPTERAAFKGSVQHHKLGAFRVKGAVPHAQATSGAVGC